MTQIYQFFKRAMDAYGVQGKELALLAGITPNQLSEFRNGKKWLSQKNFAALLEGMDQLSPGSKRYFCELLAGETLEIESEDKNHTKKLVDLIESADDDQIDAVLLAIGKKWKKTQQNEPIRSNYGAKLNPAMPVVGEAIAV